MRKPLLLTYGVLLLAALIATWTLSNRARTLESSAKLDTERIAKHVAGLVTQYLEQGLPLDNQALRRIFMLDSQIGYVIVDDWIGGLRVGEVNPPAMIRAPERIRERIFSQDFQNIAGELAQQDSGGSEPGFDVLSIRLVDKTVTDSDPVAVIKLGYVVPGFQQIFSKILVARWIALFLGLLFVGTLIQGLFSQKGKLRDAAWHPGEERSSLPEEVDLLEESEAISDVISLSQPMDDVGENWINLLNHSDTAVWDKRGAWYAISDFIMGNPWVSSLVRNDIQYDNYIYRLKAKKLEGGDGFIVLFDCDAKPLVWVLGGWHNTRSEVAGFEITRYSEPIERNRWYEVTVQVAPKTISGYLNGDRKWTLERENIQPKDYSHEFLSGIGVATWNTVCKFKDLYILNKVDEDTMITAPSFETDTHGDETDA